MAKRRLKECKNRQKKDKVQLVCTLSVEENTFVVSGELLNLNDSSWLFLWNVLKFW